MTKRIKLLGHSIHREPAGVLCKDPVWVFQYGCWIHIHESLFGMLREAITEYKHDRHLAF